MVYEATATIAISAAKTKVMDVIADFAAYPEWVPHVKRAELVEPGPHGRDLRVHFALDAGLFRDEYTLAYDWEGDDAVHWHLVSGRVLKAMDGTYALIETDGRTEVVYRLAVALHIPVPGFLKRQAEKVIIETALRELKNRVEAR